MKLKILLLVLAVFVVSTSLAGCGRATSIRVPDQSIPFLILDKANDGGTEAHLNFWDLKNVKIIQTDKVIYTLVPSIDIKSEQATYETYNGDRPLYWDGKDCIILPWFFKSETNLYKRTETIAELPKVGEGLQSLSREIFGKDVEIVRIPTGNSHEYKYTVKLWDGEKYIEKELNLNYEFQDTNSQPSYPVAIGNDETNLNILVSGGYNPQTGMDLFLCTVDKGNWTSKWYKISVEDDAGLSPSNPPNSSNSIPFEGNFYVPSGCCKIAVVSTAEHTCRMYKEFSGLKPDPDEIANGVSILGSYNDILVALHYSLRGSVNEQYILAFKDSGELLGMLHLMGNNVDVLNKNGDILSNATLNKNVSPYFPSLVFPKMNGGM